MDFYQIGTRETKHGVVEVYPDFTVGRSKDLMVRGRAFYAIWDEAAGLWSTDEYDVQRLIDSDLRDYAAKLQAEGVTCSVKYLHSFNSNSWNMFRKFVSQISDNSHQLDQQLTFANTEVKKSDYVSRRLPYSLAAGSHAAWDELLSVLYASEERAKIEWTIGAIISGDSKKIQKFLVLYGPAGTGKSTILNIVEKLFVGYTTTFEAKALGGNNNAFATEAFKTNPLVAIQHDGDLSRIEDNTKLNSIISHEEMTMNEKYKPSYTARVNAFLLMGTNQPVRISDAKSGIIRRLIDVVPTGAKIPVNHYHVLMSQIDFELGAIAHHCLEIYRTMGKNYYNSYRPIEMMLQTDVFFNFIEAHYDLFRSQDGVTLKQAYALYKEFCSDTGVDRVLPQYKVREELRNYFEEFRERTTIDGETFRSYYHGFKAVKFKTPVNEDSTAFSLVLDETESLLDRYLADLPAQYANPKTGAPKHYWSDEPRLIDGVLKKPDPSQVVETTLKDLDTTKLHYVKVPEDHIVIDFDLKDESGNKSRERNLAAASEWPATYGEYSKSGCGVHLHYRYTGGDVSELRQDYSDGIEIKRFRGDASLRRAYSRSNAVPIAEISSGLPLKEKKMLAASTIQSEKGLRDLIARNLRKEIHSGTKPSVDFIRAILDEAYDSGMPYDVTDLRSRIVAFANNSTNQPLNCLKTVQQMKFKSAEELAPSSEMPSVSKDGRLVFFDVEVFPNLFVVCWKFEGSDTVVKMINPKATDIESLFSMRLVGFNNRRYDNHILYAAHLGYTTEQLYALSQKIIDNKPHSLFGEAYNLSYTDIYDYSSKKQSLKKFEIELGVHHLELDLPWDQPVPENMWNKVVEYCCNDVVATEVVHKSRSGDFAARLILAELSGLSPNDTTQKHTAKIIFGDDRTPQKSFVYTDLSKEFPGYLFERGKSTYKGVEVGEGGYVYAEPGIYENVALLDVASMHPTSIEVLNLFGPYTSRFTELKQARLAIKHKEYKNAGRMLGGRLAKYLDGDEASAKALSDALKIVINIVYGLTSAKFDNPFRDPRNIDNIVAKRGALFMVDLKEFVKVPGFIPAHIKTDSIKIPNATPEIIDAIMDFGKSYGYEFEHEATYDKFCLVNEAVYVARKDGVWSATGAQFQHPYVFKTLFDPTNEITFDDLCETKQVTKGAMYLDFDAVQKPMYNYEGMHFVGRTGRFVPVTPESGGGLLITVRDDKKYAVAGTKGFFWVEAEIAKNDPDIEIDMSYFEHLANQAVKTIEKFGSFEDLIKE